MTNGAFHEIVASLDYPMFVVTAFDGTERSGCLVGFVTQCSIDPPRVLACISRTNHTARVVRGTETLVVHALRAHQFELARLFGEETGDAVDKFARCAWHDGPGGTPVLDGCDWFAGRITARVDLGDHDGQVLAIFDAARASTGGGQLGFQAVRAMDAGHEP